jgi:release factor glutamine methyltransferase
MQLPTTRARRVLRRTLRGLLHRLYRPYVLWRMARPGQTRVGGRTLLTDPQVFHPTYFLSTRILIDYLRTLDLRGKRLLDMGTGSGAVGLFAESRGAVVTAVDVNPYAVALARKNADRNAARVELLESDLFAALAGRTFDVICFNIPFYPRDPRNHLEAAFFAGREFETVRSFAAGCTEFVAQDGAVVIIFSEDSGHDRILSFFTEAGLTAIDERVTRRLLEKFHTLRFRRGPR